MKRSHHRQLILLFMALILPIIAIVVMGWMILGQDRKLSEKSKQEQLVAERKRAMNEIRDRPVLISFPVPLNRAMVRMTASMSFDCTSPAGGQSRFLSAFEHELEDPCIKNAYSNRCPIASAYALGW
jgi:hypothetical protein